MPYETALNVATTHRHNYLEAYVSDLGNVIDMAAIRDAGLCIGVDPLGGAGVRYWVSIAERYVLKLTVVNDDVDPTFRFIPVDWDGRIRMDPSSPYAMQHLISLKDDSTSPSPATPTTTGTASLLGARDCFPRFIILRSLSTICFNIDHNGTASQRWEKPS